MNFADRIEKLPPYLFAQISKKVAAKKAEGIDVISFGIGDPDLPTPQHILDALSQAAAEPANHRYPETEGLPDFRRAVAEWYRGRFGVTLDPDKEVISLIGSKEGIGHIALCFIDPGDIALVPDPAYPVYEIGTMFAGGSSYAVPLLEENGFLPDFDAVPGDIASRAKLLWLNYPNNPTGAVADIDFFERAVHFAKRHDIAICHDGPYSEVAYDGYKPVSFLQAEGAKDVGIEFHSLSKRSSMPGYRSGFVVAPPDLTAALRAFRPSVGTAPQEFVQRAAIAAWSDEEHVRRTRAAYRRKRDLIRPALEEKGIRIAGSEASFFLWLAVPDGETSEGFATRLLEHGVVVAPGSYFGPAGEGYARLALVATEADCARAAEILREVL
jgi:LL-diaminopimelate aminotransferase